jgi:hypothetical protein
VNGDGYADLVVGSPGTAAYVYHGSAGGLSLTADWSAVGEAQYGGFGWSVASAGDVNRDGYADLVVGAPNNSGAGKAYLYHGSADSGCTVSCLRVAAIGMTLTTRAGSGFVNATVTVRDENGAPVARALVSAVWDLPGGGTMAQTKNTGPSGTAAFTVSGEAGIFTITVTDVTKRGYTFDPANSTILSKSIVN